MPDPSEHSALVNLPAAYYWLIPELRAIEWPHESRADCNHCVMVAGPDEDPAAERFFRDDVRCCGFHPELPNHTVGRILLGGGLAEKKVLERIGQSDGLAPTGIEPPTSFGRRYEWGEANRFFGRDPAFRCPYWVGGDLACGVWEHREAVCRTWFCHHVDGVRGVTLWNTARAALGWADYHLARYCLAAGTAPESGDSRDAWRDWFILTAHRLNDAVRDEIEALADDTLGAIRERLREYDAARRRPWPSVVEPSVHRVEPIAGGFRLYGDARYDPVEVPPEIFAFFAQLNGYRSWSDALAEARDEVRAAIDSGLIERLLHAGIIGPAQ